MPSAESPSSRIGHADEAQKRLRHVSLLLELARLAAKSRDLSSVVERAMDLTTEALAATLISVHLVTEDGLALHGHRCPTDPAWQEVVARATRLGVGDRTLAGRAARERRTVAIGVEHWPDGMRASVERLSVRFGAATPMLADDRLVGVLTVGRARGEAFAPDELHLLESCAAQLASVVEHARLFEEEHRRARDLARINEVGALMAEHLDLPSILAIGVRQVTRISAVSRTELLLLEPERDQLRMVAASPEDVGAADLLIPIRPNSLAEQALASGKPAWTSDAMNDPRVSTELAKRYGYHSILEIPLVTNGKQVGVMALCDKRRERRFSDAEIGTAVAICNQLACAIANARLFEDLRRSYEKLARTQEQLIGQERLAALGELAAVMAHEVRNPLAIIFNAVASLKKLEPPNGDAQTLVEIVAEEAGQLNRIVGDLLDFARPHEPVFRLESIEELVRSALESAKGAEPAEGIEFAVAIGGSLPSAHVDARLLKQALINLIANAIQALPSGGRVEVRAVHLVRDDVVELSVIDNGPGIARELGGRVLQPFFTTKATGTGLGLAIVKRIAEAHRGHLVLGATPGGGTTSTLRLPLRPASSAPPARAG